MSLELLPQVLDAMESVSLIEAFLVEAMTALDFSVAPRRSDGDGFVPDALPGKVSFECGWRSCALQSAGELGAVVGLDAQDFKRESLEQLTGEPDGWICH